MFSIPRKHWTKTRVIATRRIISEKVLTLIILDAAAVEAVMKKGKKKGGKSKGDVEVSMPRDLTSEDSGEFVPILAME
eukprot:CCRYP_017496-RA/>CCRYP_017496-RA protein AED:0.25 eAED:0.25 QI:0/-1/0/1/-1/1/1/0/77